MTRLFQRAQRGEQGGLDALLTRLRRSLIVYLGRRIAWDDAEDLSQVALMRIMRVLRTIEPDRAARYMVRVARNLLREEHRTRELEAWRSARAALAYHIAPPEAPDVALENDDLIRAVHRTLATLPPELRDIVRGTLQDLSPSDIAAEQHVHPTTIRTRLLRARALLRRELGPYTDLIANPTARAGTPGADRGEEDPQRKHRSRATSRLPRDTSQRALPQPARTHPALAP